MLTFQVSNVTVRNVGFCCCCLFVVVDQPVHSHDLVVRVEFVLPSDETYPNTTQDIRRISRPAITNDATDAPRACTGSEVCQNETLYCKCFYFYRKKVM